MPSAGLLAAALEVAPLGILLLDRSARITYLNRHAREFLRLERTEAEGRSLASLPGAAGEAVDGAFRAWVGEGRPTLVHGVGTRIRLDGAGSSPAELEVGFTPSGPGGSGGAVVTLGPARHPRPELERLEEDADRGSSAAGTAAEGANSPTGGGHSAGDPARFAQRLQAVGRLAGGFAHDFNNLLAAILGSAELALEAGVGPEAHADLELIVASAKRGQSLVERLLGFSRRRAAERRPEVLARLVTRVEPFLRERLPAEIGLRVSCRSDAPVLVDPDAIHQLLLNLVLNAASDLHAGGSIRVTCRAASHAEVPPGAAGGSGGGAGWLELAIRDTGPGAAGPTLDTFLAGRQEGGGRPPSLDAMGLVVAFAIVEDHGGVVDVQRVPNEGSTVRCFFPVHRPPLEAHDPKRPHEGPEVTPALPLRRREDT